MAGWDLGVLVLGYVVSSGSHIENSTEGRIVKIEITAIQLHLLVLILFIYSMYKSIKYGICIKVLS